MAAAEIDIQKNPVRVMEGCTPRGYCPELDVVRFCAFLLVFIHHNLPHHASSNGWLVLTSAANACGMGLCLFFTLSAYLITGLLLRERREKTDVSVEKFYVRRILRIWPLYLVGILVGVIWALVHHHPHEVTAFLWYLLFAGNVYCASFGWSGNPMTPLWSISIEEQFYLVWPWAMRYLTRRGLMLCAAFFILAANIALYVLGSHHASTDHTVWANTFVQSEMFATGIILALSGGGKLRRSAGLGVLLCVIGPLCWFFACFTFHVKAGDTAMADGAGPLMIGYMLTALGCAAVLYGFTLIGPSHMPRWAVALGKISFGLYVYHLLAGAVVRSVFEYFRVAHSSGAGTGLALLLTILMAKLSYSLIETPFLRLKRRFELIHSTPI